MTDTKRPGRWKPGESGNPKGRPPDSGKVAKLRESIAEHLPAIVAELVERAKAGGAQAARLLIERVIPPIKAIELPVAMALPNGTLADQGRAVLAAAGEAALAPGQAAQLLAGLGALARLVETDELEARIATLEARHGLRS